MITSLSTLSNRSRAALALALALPGLAACQPEGQTGNGAAGNQAGAATAVANPCGSYAPVLKAQRLPEQTGTNETELNCTAWLTFIQLNWKADPAKPGFADPGAAPASFGTPGDMSPKVWESYLEAANVFGGTAPLKGLWQAKRPAKMLARTSKFGNLDLSSITQAGGGNHWLTNQRGDVTYYEILMNQDEYEFISHNELTTSAGQLACAQQTGKNINGTMRGGFNMPSGPQDGWDDTDCKGNVTQYGQGVGSIEIKAAWTPLPADHSLDYRYKTAIAQVKDPGTNTMRQVTVGLVGLHIIRKRFAKLPWIWSTFEHIDNTPDEAPNNGFSPPQLPPNANRRPSPGFTFFNPTCNPQTDRAFKCVHNAPPTPCLLGTDPATCQRYNAPMQITRINPVGASANSVTAYAWSLLPATSVFNYYRLINVQWPTGPLAVPPPGQRVPLPMGAPMPTGKAGGPGAIVANTTMESFQQKSNSCMDCHANFASIVMPGQTRDARGLRRVSATPAQQPYAADYSFIFLSETTK